MEFPVRLILLLPLFVAAFNGMMGLFLPAYRRQEWIIGGLATLAVAIPFGLTVMLFLGFEQTVVVNYFTWMAAGDLHVDFAYRIDQLSLLMTLIVTGIGALIHLYSIGYMHGDPGFYKFFAYLNLFIFAMLNLVLADNLVVLFLGWEGVGLCSYLLIGFWYKDRPKVLAANKAFIANRIGDFAFLLGMFLLFREITAAGVGPFGLDFTTLFDNIGLLGAGTITAAVLLFFIGATGKSAQIPLFVWLPDAMAGPTPVSALIHAATMVTAGLYLLARLSPIVLQAPEVMVVIAFVGAFTAIMAATIAITQNDIKKVLAYSTVSQLGFMFMAAGVGAFFVSIFHVMTHAFFKGCLFLGSGSVIHGMHHVEHELEHRGHVAGHKGSSPVPEEHHLNTQHYDGPFDPQDMRTMGGLKRHMPITRWTFLIATLAIAGIPLFSGFFSKDEILFKTFGLGLGGYGWAYVVYFIGVVTAFLTAIYMTRCYVLTFEGRERWPNPIDIKPHESPWTMTVPLVVLAFLSIFGGLLGLPAVLGDVNWIHHYLASAYGGPVAEPPEAVMPTYFHTIEWVLLGVGALIGILGVTLAWMFWGHSGLEADRTVRRKLGGLYGFFERKYYLDEAYDAALISPIDRGSRRGLAPFDLKVVDGAVNGAAALTRSASSSLRRIQTGLIPNYALAVVLGVVVVVALMMFV